MSYTTTSYGSWSRRVNTYSTSPDSDVLDYINGGDSAWRDLLEESGARAEIQRTYRAAIDAALPPSVALAGDEFIGPAEPDEGEFDDYPTDEDGNLDFAAIVEDIDLAAIIDREEPLTLQDIGRDVLKSGAQDPAKAAAAAMARLKVKPMIYLPHPESRRPRALFRSGDVTDALAARPGRGTRTDLKDQQA
ncbi:hypothetical protein [Streptomyces subrutilus]|uniref:hypothetical protein n=1 Tax=Streptomyces subrutilus TaxID=36818 RepID=UPI002E1019DF|nr:hypothetical protein OG479_32845 [Streptomyces subrutilus]